MFQSLISGVQSVVLATPYCQEKLGFEPGLTEESLINCLLLEATHRTNI